LGHIMHERPYTVGFFTMAGSDPDPVRRAARRIIERMAPDEPDPLEMWAELQQRLGISPSQANKVMLDIALDTLRRFPAYYAQVFAGKCLSLFAQPRDERLEDYEGRTRSQWPGRFLSQPIKEGRLPDLNPSEFGPAQQWEAGRASAIADLVRPALFAPGLAALFVLGLAAALLRPGRRLV